MRDCRYSAFAWPDRGGLHQGQQLALLHRVAEVLEHFPDGTRRTTGNVGDAARVVADLAMNRRRFRDRALKRRRNLDAGAVKGLECSKLDSALVQNVLAVVVRPRREGQGSLRPRLVLLGDRVGTIELSDLRIAKRAFVYAVDAAPANRLAARHQLGPAFDADRLRHVVRLAPFASRFRALGLWQLPAGGHAPGADGGEDDEDGNSWYLGKQAPRPCRRFGCGHDEPFVRVNRAQDAGANEAARSRASEK